MRTRYVFPFYVRILALVLLIAAVSGCSKMESMAFFKGAPVVVIEEDPTYEIKGDFKGAPVVKVMTGDGIMLADFKGARLDY